MTRKRGSFVTRLFLLGKKIDVAARLFFRLLTMPSAHRASLLARLVATTRENDARRIDLAEAPLVATSAIVPAYSDRPIRSAEAPLPPRVLGPRLKNLNILLFGTCTVEYLAAAASRFGYQIDFFLYDASRHADIPVLDFSRSDAAIVGLTLRHILHDATDRAMDVVQATEFWTAAEAEAALLRAQAVLEERVGRFRAHLNTLPIFFFSFAEPSFNHEGDLIRPTGPAHFTRFMRMLNDIFSEVVAKHRNCYLFDFNQALNFVGRGHLQDDAVTHFTHNSIISDWDDVHDAVRIIPPVSNLKTYDVARNLPMLQDVILNQIADQIKIIRQQDQVKLIIVDLDDTLWRGVAAEDTIEGWARGEGWPLGLVEALLYFKKRGGLLAICSKNDDEPTRERYQAIWGGRLSLDAFASIRINWHPKSENIAQILAETNLLPESVVFIDDNPREIDEVCARFPAIRCLGGDHHDWRRIILRSPETQVAFISDESSVRTQLIRARVEREQAAKTMSREDWLRSLNLEATIRVINNAAHPLISRAFELINKTNQFNTNGRRWTATEFDDHFNSGGLVLVASLRDKTVDNGLIGVTLVHGDEIVQTVLSCRVFGLGAELALGAIATEQALRAGGEAHASIVNTGKNATCHDFYVKLGFSVQADGFAIQRPVAPPDWIRLTVEDIAAGL